VIKEEQLLQQHLPDKMVAEHALLHQSELNYLDESVITLKTKLSVHNIHTIIAHLNNEFKHHIYQCDKDMAQKIIELRR